SVAAEKDSVVMLLRCLSQFTPVAEKSEFPTGCFCVRGLSPANRKPFPPDNGGESRPTSPLQYHHGLMRVRGRAGLIWAGLVLVIGLGIGAGAGTLLDSVEQGTAARVMDRRTALAQSAVAAEVRRYLDTLRTVAAGIGGQSTLSPAEFDTATAPLGDAKLVG